MWRSGVSATRTRRPNAHTDGQDHRGWLIGHFLDEEEGVRASRDVEVKWGVHPAGEDRREWVTDEQRTMLPILVSGQLRLDLSVGSVTLENEGVMSRDRCARCPETSQL
jgi:hypothetical protein